MAQPKLHVTLPQNLERLIPSRHLGLGFGIPALDALLPGGVPRGQITALDAPLGSGGTALLLSLAETTLRIDEGVAFIDAARSLAPQAAAHLAQLGAFWVIRPKGTESAWWCADVVLRTGAFGLVIVDQGPAATRPIAVRLQRLARDKDAALMMREASGHRFAAPGHRGTEHKFSVPSVRASVCLSFLFRIRSRSSRIRRRVAGPALGERARRKRRRAARDRSDRRIVAAQPAAAALGRARPPSRRRGQQQRQRPRPAPARRHAGLAGRARHAPDRHVRDS